MDLLSISLSELGDIVGGATPSTIKEEYYGGDIPWITPKDLSGYSERYIERGERSISKEGFKSCSTRMLPAGSVLFTSRAPIGYVAIAKNDLCTNQGFKSIIPFDMSESLFIFYLLVLNKAAIEATASGTTFKEVSGSVMRQVKVKVPRSHNKRIAIAAALSCLDDRIELNNQIIANLEAQAQAIFDEWFMAVDVDFPVGVLSDIAEVNPTRTLSKGQVATYIEMSNLSTSNSFPINWIDNTPFNGGMKFKNGDTVIARITPCLENGKTAYISCLDDGAVGFGSTEYVVLSAKDGYCNEMLYFLARNEDFRNYAIQNMNGSSGRQRVSGETIGNYEMAIPTKEESKQFEAVAKPIMQTIRNCAMQNRKLAQTRDTLLPKFMSGEIEVPVEG